MKGECSTGVVAYDQEDRAVLIEELRCLLDKMEGRYEGTGHGIIAYSITRSAGADEAAKAELRIEYFRGFAKPKDGNA